MGRLESYIAVDLYCVGRYLQVKENMRHKTVCNTSRKRMADMVEQFGQGTFSQYVHFNPSTAPVTKKPNCFSHETAASIPLCALTAYACLDWLPPVRVAPRRIVIRGASGGTGSWLVQSKYSILHVTHSCSHLQCPTPPTQHSLSTIITHP
jgi:hypothetical protein